MRAYVTHRILKTNLPVSNYVGEMWVEPGTGGQCVVRWKAQFQRPPGSVDPASDDRATEGLIAGVFQAGLDNLRVITRHGLPANR
jgi:Polyketide cyclase / dehydrase and lipid transport